MASFLVDETEVGEWNVQGLPTDDLSVQNGILVTRATRYPVLIDPQGQGRTWLISKESACGLRVTQLNDRQFRNHLEECLQLGRPLLIENIEEELDPLLDPVLDRRYIKKGGCAVGVGAVLRRCTVFVVCPGSSATCVAAWLGVSLCPLCLSAPAVVVRKRLPLTHALPLSSPPPYRPQPAGAAGRQGGGRVGGLPPLLHHPPAQPAVHPGGA